nr:LPS export ABC transporter permease LptF [Desulfobacterales bacterium]
MCRIVHRYILKELCVIFGLSLTTFTFILLVTKLFALTDLVVNKRISPDIIALLIAYTIPYFFVFTFPMSTLLAVLMTFLRLSHDNEITAMKAAGINLYQLLPPVLILSISAYLIDSFIAIHLLPKGNRAFNDLVYRIAKERAYIGIKPRIFNDDFKDIVLYVNKIDPSGKVLEGVFISDQRDPAFSSTIIAKKGVILTDKENKVLVLRVFQGTIHHDSEDLSTSSTTYFKTYDLVLNLEQLGQKRRTGEIGESEMDISELWAKIRSRKNHDVKYNLMLMELHKKFSIPFACLVLGLIGVPLGIQTRASGPHAGVSLGLIIFLLYYILISAASSLGESGLYPPVIGMWLPNILLGILAVFMLKKTAEETEIRLINYFNLLLHFIRRRLRSLFRYR